MSLALTAKRWLGILAAGLALGATRAASAPDGALPPCPPTPNCVSTEADPADAVHHIAPLALPDGLEPEAALDAFEALIRTAHRTEILERSPLRLHATDRTLIFRFVDDVEARIDVEGRRLHVRSASRVGAGDMGTNRRRVSAWLTELAASWGVAWPAAR